MIGDIANGPNLDGDVGFEEASLLPLNIKYDKSELMFGMTSNNINKQTNYTSFHGRSNSFLGNSGNLSTTMYDHEANMTNYETAIAWGKLGLHLDEPHRYQK